MGADFLDKIRNRLRFLRFPLGNPQKLVQRLVRLNEDKPRLHTQEDWLSALKLDFGRAALDNESDELIGFGVFPRELVPADLDTGVVAEI